MTTCTRFWSVVFVLGASLSPALAQQPPPSSDLHDHGWYLAGKGGPSFGMLSGVSPSQAGPRASEDAANNMIGAFGMAGGYELTYRYHIPMRLELEFMNRTEVTYDASPMMSQRATGALASTVQNVTTMAKGYWHFPVNSAHWWPFVSAGVGWSRNTVKSRYTAPGQAAVKTQHVSNSLAWTAGVGATFKLGPQVMNDIELRYVDLGAVDWGMDSARNLSAQDFGAFGATELVFSLRYMF